MYKSEPRIPKLTDFQHVILTEIGLQLFHALIVAIISGKKISKQCSTLQVSTLVYQPQNLLVVESMIKTGHDHIFIKDTTLYVKSEPHGVRMVRVYEMSTKRYIVGGCTQ